MRILHVIESMDPARGGPVEQIRRSADAMRQLGHVSEVVSTDEPDDPWLPEIEVRHYPQGHWTRRYGFSPRFRHWVSARQGDYDVAIIHGLWTYATVAAARAFQGGGLPYIVFSHGMLDPWFGKVQPVKHIAKQLYWTALLAKALKGARTVLFTTAEEQRLAANAFIGGHYNARVVTYGTAEADESPGDQSAAFRTMLPALGDRPYLLFMGRIHPKKGCDLLIEALSARADLPYDIVLAGPDQIGWSAQLKRRAAHLGLAHRIHWPGMLLGPAKWGAYRSCTGFILPSHQENFGIVVAEAMACARPVMITDKVNIWREVAAAGGGLIAADDLPGIIHLLDHFAALTGDEQRAMGDNARHCFERHFRLEAATQDLAAILEDAIASGGKARS